MALMSYPDPATLPELHRKLLGQLPPANILKMLAGAGDAFVPWLQMVKALSSSTLGNEIRELAILRTGHLAQSEYELYHHRIIARQIGVSEERIRATTGPLPIKALTEGENAALQLIDEVVEKVKGSAATLQRARRYFTEQQVLELLLIAGLYRLISTLTETLEIEAGDIDPPAAGQQHGLGDFQDVLNQAR